jgi:4-amino-4-deoxy-L-arabinose transferase-like glycosyltransferase
MSKRANRTGLLVLGLILLAQTLVNLGLLSTSAHSGQVAIPWLMNRGMILFGDIFEQHAPLTSVIAAAAQRLLPFAPVDVDRLLNLVLALLTTVLVYRLAYRLADRNPAAGVAAALWWFLWQPVYGNVMFYFDAVLGALFCAALLVWLEWGEHRPAISAVLAGLLLGLATLAKQHAWAGVVAFGLWLAVVQRRALVPYLAGVVVFPLLALVVVAMEGNLASYVYWTYGYNLSGLMPGERPNGDLLRKLVLSSLFVPAFAMISLLGKRKAEPILVLLLWGAASLTLVPRIGDIHAIGQMSLAAVMTGVVAGMLVRAPFSWPVQWQRLKAASPSALILGGVMIAALLGAVITTAAPYASRPFGGPGIPAHDEFKPLGERLRALADEDDTLYVLPLTDSTPQIFPLADMQPPGIFVKGWSWYWDAEGVTESLLTEFRDAPPDLVVIFRDILQSGQPGVTQFVGLVEANYTQVEVVPNVRFHGDAEIWRLNAR